MSSMLRLFCAATAAALMLPAHAVVAYDESVSGDLPNLGTAALPITLALGSNLVIGTTGNPGSGAPGSGIDRDYFSITLPAGWQLDALTVLPGTTALGVASFIGVQVGTQVTVSPTGGTAEGLLGWRLYSVNDIDTDILPMMGFSDLGSTGFVPPLPAGSYAFWVQEFSPGTSPYRFELSVSAVPEPAPALLLAAGLAGLALRRRLRG